ncbi:cupin domain-containing protein [Desulfocurvus sp. DL9XJH121]
MITGRTDLVEAKPVTGSTYKGQRHETVGVTSRLLSDAPLDARGNLQYALRQITVEPGGVIPIHSHAYLQTIFMLSGSLEFLSYDPDTDEVVDRRVCGPGEYIYNPSMEPHAIRNAGDEPGIFVSSIGYAEAPR